MSPRSVSKSSGSKASRHARIDADQVVHPIRLSHRQRSEYKFFEKLIAILYGPTGIGKTTFEICIPGMHVLATEPINNPAKFAYTRIENWPTFVSFIDKAEADPKFVKEVKMWGIDTIDVLVAKGISTICYEWGITDLSDEGYSRAWIELKSEIIHQLCRLTYLGPGILLVSHERQRKVKGLRLETTKNSMDLSDSICNAVSFLSSVILHMRYVNQSKTSKELGHMRCLSVGENDDEDAKDNTRRIRAICDDTGVIKFKRERQVVRKILRCFEDNKE